MQENVLDAFRDADLRVYAIWFSMYPTDSRDRWPATVLSDARVVHYWDQEKALGLWYVRREPELQSRVAAGSSGLGGTILWDAYLVYGRSSQLQESPSELHAWGRTILGTKEDLRAAVEAVAGSADGSQK